MDHLTDAGTSAYFFGAFSVVLATVCLWGDLPSEILLSWATVTAAITIARYIHFRTFDHNQSDDGMLNFHRLYSIGTMLSAFCWGTFGVGLVYIDDQLTQAMIVILTLAICSGSVIVSSSLVHLSRAFIFVVLAPMLTALIVMGDAYLPIATLTVGGVIFLGSLAVSIHASVVNSYHAQSDNQVLIEQLRDSKKSAESMNRQLKTEIAVRNEAEAHMVEARDKAEKAARAKSDFVATMSHEIRTPMNGVLGMTELLMNTDLSAKQFRFADTIRRSGEALLSIINDILDFSKIDAGKLEIQHTVFDLRQLVEDTASFFAEAAQSKRIELVSNFPPNEHAAYRGDPDRIRQILLNLVGNSLKFTERGEIALEVGTVHSSEDEALVKFAIRDTGIGIAEEHQAHIFESFQQADGSTTRKFGGTGLGLTICSRLVGLMKGEIKVKSDLGHGSTFWFTVKLTPAPASAITNQVRDTKDFSGLRVLVIDDNETNREVLEHQLANWKMLVHTASSGKHALKLLNRGADRQELYDVIILDRQMPEIDGIELARRIRSNEETKSVAIVMLSSINQLEETGEWYSAGIDVYVNKPVRQSELYEGLCVALEETNKVSDLLDDDMTNPDSVENQLLYADVLVAEDNPINQELARSILENMGCRVVVVDNGREAVEAITEAPLDQLQKRYDLILMDCQMPELDGFAATKEIRHWEAREDKHLPIIALTANAMSGDREKCLDAGMDDYLSKPFTQEELFGVCEKWLSLETKNRREIAEKKAVKSEAKKQVQSAPRVELDGATLDSIRALQREGGPDILAKVIHLYLKNSPSMLEKLQEATATGNAELLRGTAHSLKSSSANIGALQLAELCADLEKMGRDKSLDGAMSTLGILEFEFEGVCNALHAELARDAA
ncbi:MAG: response regulator [Pseudomonadota bacterium]